MPFHFPLDYYLITAPFADPSIASSAMSGEGFSAPLHPGQGCGGDQASPRGCGREAGGRKVVSTVFRKTKETGKKIETLKTVFKRVGKNQG